MGDNDAAFLGPWANYPLKTDSFLSVEVRGNEIIVITADFRAVYCKAKDRAQLDERTNKEGAELSVCIFL